MPIAFNPRGRVDERNRPGSAYYAALYEDEPLEPGVFTEATMPERGILSYPGPFGDIAEEDETLRNPVFASNFATDEPAFVNQRRSRFPGVDIEGLPITGETLAPGILTESPINAQGILSYLGAFDDAIEPDDIAENSVFISNFGADGPPFMDTKRARFSNTAFAAEPNVGDEKNSGVPMEAPRLYSGIRSYFGQFDNAVEPETAAPYPVPASSLVQGVDIDAAQDTGPAMAPDESDPGPQAVFSPMGDLFFQEAANNGAPAGKAIIGHAEGLEALIPFWGAGRNLLADLEEKNYRGAALNAALLASDFFLWGAPAKIIYKAGVAGYKKDGLKGMLEGSKYAIKGPGTPDVKDRWDYAKYRMEKYDMRHPVDKGVTPQPPNELHHWLIPQNEWGKNWPDAIKHHPFNIIELPKPVHRRVHTKWLGQPRYNRRQRYWHGKPRWFKALNAEMVGHSIEGWRSYRRVHDEIAGPNAGPRIGTTKYRPVPYD